MGVFEKLRRLDERFVRTGRRDVYAPITTSERWIANAPRGIPVLIALTLGLFLAVGFELFRPYPQLNNFLIFWGIGSAVAFPLAAAGVERTRVDVERREQLLAVQEQETEAG